MATSNALIESTVRHQVYLERLKSGEVNQFTAFLQRMDKQLKERLTQDDLTAFSRTRLEILLKSVERMLSEVFEGFYDDLAGHLTDLGDYEAGFEARNLNNAITSKAFEAVIPSPEQVRAAIFTTPLSVRGADGGKLLEPFIKDWTHVEKKKISGAIRQGFFEGQTNFQIIQAIRGTKANNFSDGLLAVTARNADAIVRTSVQHVASVSRHETWTQNDDVVIGYRWVSTLDGRTSPQCRSLDGQTFKLNGGPKPPIHIRCRSTTAAELDNEYDFLGKGRTRASQDGPVRGNTTYYDWLKEQPSDFQDDVLGKARGNLFRNSGLSAERFSKLNLDRTFQPLTLDQMREKEPNAFTRVANPDVISKRAEDYTVKNGARDNVEYAYVSDKYGNEVLKKRGQKSSVSFTDSEVEKMISAEGVTLFHNHPASTSLSVQDLYFASSLRMKNIVAFGTHDTAEYVASKFKSTAAIKAAYTEVEPYVMDIIWPKVRARILTSEQASAFHAHLVNLLLDQSGVIKYEPRKVSKNTSESLQIIGDELTTILDEFTYE